MFSNPAMVNNRTLPIHRWVPWIAGFSAKFVWDVLDYYELKAEPGFWVFDPFAGVGTTLVEARMHGFDVHGAELNPYPELACRAKLEWTISPELLAKWIDKLRGLASRVDSISSPLESWNLIKGSRGPPATPRIRVSRPKGFKTREEFFNPATERKVLLLKQFVQSVPEELSNIFRAIFAAGLVKFSNYAYGPSLGRKSVMAIRRQMNAPVGRYFLERMEEVQHDLKWLSRTVLPGLKRVPEADIALGSVFESLRRVPNEKIGAIITSPPYLNNYHYPRNTRPQLYWLGMVKSPKEMERIHTESFGKFWQTVRDLPGVRLKVEHEEVQAVVSDISVKNPDKGIYGGQGWANYVATYFNDVDRFFSLLAPKMKDGGIIAWVIGNSIVQGIEVKTEHWSADIAGAHGFTPEGVYRIRKKRVGDSIVTTNLRNAPSRRIALSESVVVLRRTN